MQTQVFDLLGFVFMPEHVHLLVFPRNHDAQISRLLGAIKRPHSYRVKQWMIERADPRLVVLTVRERPGKEVFRFWQEGSGYDRNIINPTYLHQMLDYIHANPVRRGLVKKAGEWRWSSWHSYHAADNHDRELPPIRRIEEVL